MSRWVLDASALLALLRREPGREHVRQALKDGAAMSTVNLSEVVAKLIDIGVPDTSIRGTLGALGLATVEFDSALAYKAGLLRAATRRAGFHWAIEPACRSRSISGYPR